MTFPPPREPPHGQLPGRAAELIALADSLEVLSVISLTYEPGEARHRAQLRQATRKVHDAYKTAKEAAAAYLDAQYELVVAAREAHDDGLVLTELDTSWLGIPAEEAAIGGPMETHLVDFQSQ